MPNNTVNFPRNDRLYAGPAQGVPSSQGNQFINQDAINQALMQYYANLGVGQQNNNYSRPIGSPFGGGGLQKDNSFYSTFSHSNKATDPLSDWMTRNLMNDFGVNDLFSNQEFKPYLDKNGHIVYSANRNTAPVSQIPGTNIKPSKQYGQTADSIRAIQDLLPYYNQAVNATVLPNELAKLNAAQATSGPYAALMTNLYNTYGSQLNDIGNEIARRNALSQAQTEQDVINGPGKGLVNSAYDLSQVFDAPWFKTRDAAAQRLQEQLAGGLSPTERDEIAKGLARQNTQNGTANTQSNTNTVANAMVYGKEGRNRLSQAIQSAAAFLPTARSGVDVFQVATGRPSSPNSGNAQFPGINNPSGNQGSQLGSQMFGGINSLQGQQMNINANKKDWLDQMNQFTGSLKNIGGLVGMMGMM